MRDWFIHGKKSKQPEVVEHSYPGYVPWRVGRSLGRTLYLQTGPEAAKDDTFIGIMESRELATLVCNVMNEHLRANVKDITP